MVEIYVCILGDLQGGKQVHILMVLGLKIDWNRLTYGWYNC